MIQLNGEKTKIDIGRKKTAENIVFIFKTNVRLWVWYGKDKTYLDVEFFAYLKKFVHVLVYANAITYVSRKGLGKLSKNSFKQFLTLTKHLLQTIVTTVR